MKRSLFSLSILFCLCTISGVAIADWFPFDVYGFLRLEYDDNVFTTRDDDEVQPEESWIIAGQLEMIFDTKRGNTYLGLRYSPDYKYYLDIDLENWNHQWDLILEHVFSPRSSGQIKHTVRVSDEPEFVEDDVTFRNNNDYFYQSLVGYYTTQVLPEKTSLQFTGNYAETKYDDDVIAELNDFTQIGGGVNLIQNLSSMNTIAAEFAYDEFDYETPFRDSELYRASANYTRMLNPKVQASVAAGWEQLNTDDEVAEDIDAPYGDLNVVYTPNAETRLTFGGGYGIHRSPVNTFSTQERLSLFARVSQEMTSRLVLMAQGRVTTGSFDQDAATSLFDPEFNTTGDEETVSTLVALTYEVNSRNDLELSWRYTELQSDVRPNEDYDRNRYYLGWRLRL